jgi:3-oxoacyl-[acyl-carrier-protein] synthase III
MPDEWPTAGLLSLATYIPRTYHDADFIASQSETPAEIIRTKLGWYQKNVPGPGDGTVAMGLRAARKVLYYSGLKPEEVDLVIYSGEEVKEYRNWPVGPKIQKELGLWRAWSFDMQQRCGTTLVALKLARDMIRSDPNLKNILIVSGYRNADLIHYPNPRVRWMYFLAAGGAAFLKIAQTFLPDLQHLAKEILPNAPLLNNILERWLLLFGIFFILVVIFFPKGVIGSVRGYLAKRSG